MKKQFLILIIFSSGMFLGMALRASAATYYIDYSSGLDSNNGTATTTPWKRSPGMPGCSNNCASYIHANGDVFVFKGGVNWPAVSLPLVIANSGTNSAADIYMGGQRCGQGDSLACNGGVAWGSGYPIFDGGGLESMMGIRGNGKSYITIDGIEIYNVGYNIEGSGHGIGFDGACQGLEIKNNYFNTNAIDAFYFQDTNNNDSLSKLYFHDNTIINSGRINIDILNNVYDDVRFYNNLFQGLGTYDPRYKGCTGVGSPYSCCTAAWPIDSTACDYHTDGLMIGAANTTTYGLTNLLIYNNKFYGLRPYSGTAAIYMNGDTTKKSINGAKIYNNQITFESSSVVGFGYGISAYNGVFANLEIYNNTIVGDACATQMSGGINIVAVNNVTIKNNIISGVDNGIILDGATAGTISIDYNLYNSSHLIYDNRPGHVDRCSSPAQCSGSPQYQEAHGLVGIPQFVALPNGTFGSADLHLQETSPAKNVGVSLPSIFTTDLDNITRSGPWDIGAYEYTTNQPCTSFTYSCSSCQSNNTMACSVISASPSYCTGGNPVLTQGCTYTGSLSILSTSLTNLTKYTVTTNWVTDNSSTGRVIYGTSLKTTKLKTTCKKFNKKGKCQTYNYTKLTTISKPKTINDSTPHTSHTQMLTSLKKNKTYYYQIIAQSGAYTSQTSILRFKTLKK